MANGKLSMSLLIGVRLDLTRQGAVFLIRVFKSSHEADRQIHGDDCWFVANAVEGKGIGCMVARVSYIYIVRFKRGYGEYSFA
jgi:hypothetical protein